MSILELYNLAQVRGINVCLYPLQGAAALSVPGAIALGPKAIETVADEKTHLSHEIGHQETGTLYTVLSPYEIRGRLEERATRWAVHNLITEEELNEAFERGFTEIWELAEYFEVTEDFMCDAIRVHQLEDSIGRTTNEKKNF